MINMGDDDGNGNDKSYESDTSTWEFNGEETQIFDSQFSDSPISSSGNKFNGDDVDQSNILQSTIPFDDTVMFEDELATQVMDPYCETQLVNLGGETQLVDFDAEIELMDDHDSFENNETQLFDGCDTEEVVVTDLEESDKTEVVDDSDDLSDEDSGRREYAKSIDLSKNDKMEYKSKTECGRSEQHTSGIGFKTFISIRAASIRAFGLAALNNASKKTKSPSCSTLSSEPDIEHRRKLLINGPETGNRCKFGKATARKLFADDPLDDIYESNDKIDLSHLETDLVGLSYIDSQEPGDASQANALDFVDNFLKVNIECDNECDIIKSTGGKSKPVLSAKGTKTLAKSTNLIDAVEKRRIFDWDNNREDEGGGEFYQKKKEAFFASGTRRLKNNKENDKSKKSIGTRILDVTVRKNLINELDKQSTDMPSGMDIQETSEVRFDTQMAAEAMEDLCFGLQLNGQSVARPVSNDGVITRQSKSKEPKRAKSDVGKRKGKISLKRREARPIDRMSVKKQCIQNVTPVARRTRQSMKDNKLENVNYASSETNFPNGFYPKGKRTCQKLSSSRQESVSRLTRLKAALMGDNNNNNNNNGNENLLEGSVREKMEPISSTCTTPINRGTPVKDSSPICMGDEYYKLSFRKSRVRSRGKSALMQELCNLAPTGEINLSPNKDTRKRKDVSLIRVLFSRHLHGDIVKQQKKILSRLGASESCSMSDATHFIADEFVRTRNMLEAIALGKPIVTHLWLESCGQACCHIDEKNFILRDAKKEKEFGFSLPASLARAHRFPLLKGYKVLITPNTKPGKEILASLVKAVHGVAVERMGRTALKDDKVLEGLLILSCEEDYAVCLPFLEKGAAIYSSELLLNGIVTQTLEYERHCLFVDHVKRTRSTIWVKKDNQYKPVGKVK